MKKHLMILGDTRIGDTFHVGCYLSRLKGEYETTWVHGSYEREAVEFMRDHFDLGIVRTIEKPSTCKPFPGDLASIEQFIGTYGKENYGEFDKVTNFTGPIFFSKEDQIVYDVKNLKPVVREKPYIVTHIQSISNWKEIAILEDMDFGIHNVGVGLKKGRVNKFAEDQCGIMLSQLAELILGAKCVVGIHSAVACLAFHLGIPIVVAHFWDGKATIRFSDFRDKCTDLIGATEEDIKKAVEAYK